MSDAWSTSRLSHRPSEPAYCILDCRIFTYLVVFQPSHSRTCMSACAALATTTMLLMMQSCQKYVHTVQRYSRQIQFCNWRPILIGKNTDVSSLSSRRSKSSTYVHRVHNTYAIMQCMYELVHSSLLYSVVALYERLVRRLARRKSTRGRSNAPWLNPVWHGTGHFYPFVFVRSNFVSWIFFKSFQTLLEVKIEINRIILTPCPAH